MDNPVLVDRRERGMTQAEYAEFLGFDGLQAGVRQIQRWESAGPRTARALSRLCGATGRRAAFFLGQEEDAQPAPDIMRVLYEALGEALLIAAERAADREKAA